MKYDSGNKINVKPVLITAFEPFGGEAINPSKYVLESLPDFIGGCKIEKLLLPVEFVKACDLALCRYDEVAPAAVIMLGQAGGRSAITPEVAAKNLMNARIPDGAGYKPKNRPIVAGGEKRLYSTLPVEGIVGAIKSLGIAAEPSTDAGEYVCNALLYSMLYHNGGAVPTGFIHVPYIKEQNKTPCMTFDDVYRAALAAVDTVIVEINK